MYVCRLSNGRAIYLQIIIQFENVYINLSYPWKKQREPAASACEVKVAAMQSDGLVFQTSGLKSEFPTLLVP